MWVRRGQALEARRGSGLLEGGLDDISRVLRREKRTGHDPTKGLRGFPELEEAGRIRPAAPGAPGGRWPRDTFLSDSGLGPGEHISDAESTKLMTLCYRSPRTHADSHLDPKEHILFKFHKTEDEWTFQLLREKLI